MFEFKSPILVTGSAGFIGSAVVDSLLLNSNLVIGIDNLNSYYDKSLKVKRLEKSFKINRKNSRDFYFYEDSIDDHKKLEEIFAVHQPKIVINLAAQAGVRYSLKDPFSYVKSNLIGFSSILECCKKFDVSNLIYASSSSVYGANKLIPFSEKNIVNHPVSFYAATKISNELMAHSYSHLYGIPSTGLRFFTVYGPWGRPDMAPMIFAKSILDGKPIEVFNFGDMMRDFTFIGDVVEGIIRCCQKPATPFEEFDNLRPTPFSSFAPHRIFNIGYGQSIKLMKFIEILENLLGKKAIKIFKPMHKADVKETYADTKLIKEWIDYKPKVSLEEGLVHFAEWYLNYHRNL